MPAKKKIPVPKPTVNVVVPMAPEVQEVADIIADLLPHELLLRTSRGQPTTETFRQVKRDEDGVEYLLWTTELSYPSVKEKNAAQREASQYFASKLSNKQVISENKEIPTNVMQIPVFDNLDDWEAQAIKSQTESLVVISD